MSTDMIMQIVEVVIMVLAFVLGRYVLPKVPTSVATTLGAAYTFLKKWAGDFCLFANDMDEKTGAEKMEYVLQQLNEVAKAEGITITDAQLAALAESAYQSYKAGAAQ